MGFYLCLLILVETGMFCPSIFWLKIISLLKGMSFKTTFKPNRKQSWHWGWSWKRHPSRRTTHVLQSEGRVCDAHGMRGAIVLSIASAFITLYRATLIKPSDQIIRSSDFESTAAWTGFVKLVKPYVFCCWRKSYFSSTVIPNFFTIDGVQHLITGYSSMCPEWAEE